MAVSRVIEVSFGRSSVALVRIDTAYFYNNGIIFKPTDIELPASYQVHWADSPQASTTIETIGTAEGAPIPDDLWDRSRVIYGWIYLHPTEDSGITAYEVRIYKNVRAGLPDGTEPTPAEQSTIDQLIGALNGAVEQAEDAQEAIENMSVSATTLAEGASATVTKSEQDGVVHLAFGIPKGATGNDGYSPTVSVTKSGKTATITITDKNGTTSAQVSDGTDGEDGVSPAVSVTDITGGHRVVITDKGGTKSFDVEDGATGATPNLTIGTVTTLEPDASATATITGTAEDPVLNLGIPRGQTGEVTEEEFTQLKEELNDFSKLATGYNLIDPSTIVDGEFWNGATASSGNYSRTPLIAVKPNTAYTFANTEANYWDTSKTRARTIVFFTADGTFISPRIDNTGNFTTPENCAFVGISFYQNARKVILIEGTYDITTQTMVYIPYVADALKVNADSIDGLSVDNISDYKVTGKNLFDKTKAVSGILHLDPRVVANEISFVSDYIPVKANVSYVISNAFVYGSRNYSIRSYVLYDIKHQKVSGESGDVKTKVVTPTVDGYLRFCGYNEQKDWTQVEVGSTPTAFEPYKIVLNDTALLNDAQVGQVNNILYGKKWAVCGDSFTAGATNTKLTSGKHIGRPLTYPWIIGNRNNMEILKFFEGGRTLAFPANPSTFTNSLTNPNASFYYQNIPADVDYITIYLGINDEHHAPNSSGGDGEDNTGKIPIGTVDDATTATYLGAWNVVLTWLITNRHNAHIGIIVTNGIQAHDEYRQGQIAIAEKYGIPYIDMNGDARTPAMLRTSNPNIPSAIKQALIQKWAVDPSTNTHPNDAAHLFESAFIENFLRSI